MIEQRAKLAKAIITMAKWGNRGQRLNYPEQYPVIVLKLKVSRKQN
jgi:hypothetical protein